MKRFAAAAAIAVGAHLFLLTQDLDRGVARHPRMPVPEAVTVLLNPAAPRIADPRPISPPPKAPLRAPVHQPAPTAAAPAAPPPPVPAVPTAAPKPAKAAKRSAPPSRPPAPRAVAPPPPAPAAPLAAEEPGPANGGRASPPLAADSGPASTAAAPAGPGPVAPALKEAEPEYGKNPPLAYPRRARQLGYEGVVVLEVLVDQTGRAEAVRLFSSSGHTILDESAVRSVTAWVFKPARRGNQAVSMWVRVPIRYELAPPGDRGP